MRPAPAQGCDYGATTDYRHCAECGTKRPVAALVEDGSAEKLLRCAEREFCAAADEVRRDKRAREFWAWFHAEIVKAKVRREKRAARKAKRRRH